MSDNLSEVHSRRLAAIGSVPGKHVVLVVDDEEACRKMIGASLARSGFEILSARNGAEALQIAACTQVPIDVAVTDIQMPGMSGFVLADQLRATHPSLPILFISGGCDSTNPDLLSRLSPTTRYMEKPFKLQALAEVLGKLCSPWTSVSPGCAATQSNSQDFHSPAA